LEAETEKIIAILKPFQDFKSHYWKLKRAGALINPFILDALNPTIGS